MSVPKNLHLKSLKEDQKETTSDGDPETYDDEIFGFFEMEIYKRD